MFGRVGEGDRDRVGVVLVDRAVADPGEQRPGVLEPGDLDVVRQRAVADVVDPPGERDSADIARRLGVGSSRMP
ncbi:hypothetical protein GCM10010294_70240 [Streptomyces griseoloalbus]|nr:hypothetical protein GCM10010294_70240 [Streptomyces griseoloalbus]